MSNVVPTARPPKVSLAALRAVQGIIELEDGSEHPVYPITGEAFQLINAAEGEGVPAEEQMMAVFEAAHRCVPSLTRKQVLAFTIDQAQHVITIASGQIAAVQALVPNGERTTSKPRRSSS